MEKTTKINEFKEEIYSGLEKLSLDISDSLIEEFQNIISNAYKKQDVDSLEEYSININDMLIADYRNIFFLNGVFEDGQLSNEDIELCLSDFQNFIEYELEERFEFINGETLIEVATDMLNEDISNGDITQQLAYMIDLNLYCDNLENQGYTETSFGVLYTY